MIRTLLTPATGNELDQTTFATALAIARNFSAHIDALHVRVDPVEVAVAAADGTGGGVLLESLVNQLEQNASERAAKALDFFTAFCRREQVPLDIAPGADAAGLSAQWHVEIGQETRWMADYGMTSDLIVASRGILGDDAVPRATLEALLIETGRPLLIPSGTTPPVTNRVAIAWKPTPQAARAVTFAMPFIARARETVVMTVEEDEGRRDDAERLLRYLAWHGIKAVFERLAPDPRGDAETLLAVAKTKADLLVMGGYGHTRLREWVVGGFTQRVLADAPMPVLMVH